MTTLKAITAAEGAGADVEDATNQAFSSLVTVIQAKAAAQTSFDLTNAADLASVETQASNNLASESGIDSKAFSTALAIAMGSVEVDNTVIKNITDTDLDSTSTKAVFKLSMRVIAKGVEELCHSCHLYDGTYNKLGGATFAQL